MKMKKKVLSAAVLAAMSVGSAQAVNLSQDGTGEAMIIPYYTVQNGEETLVSIVNTTDETKAVKVRFREAMNSREVLDFNLYLSPYDVWTAKVMDDGANGAKLITNDKSCTVPAIPAAGVPFRTYAYDGSMTQFPPDGAGTGRDRLREGYAEFIEMGTYVSDGDTIRPWGTGPDSTHVSGTPINCGTLAASWADGGIWTLNPAEDMGVPDGGLFASAAIINVGIGTETSETVTTLEAFSDLVLHAHPGTSQPTLDSANPAESVVMLNDGAADGAQVYVDDWFTGVDAVSAVMQVMVVMNEYSVNPAVDAETDWVVTFPTKHYYTDPRGAASNVYVAGRPFSRGFYGTSCETVTAAYWDREEGFIIGDTDFSPLPDGTSFQLCYEANVVNFGDSDALSSVNVDQDFSIDSSFLNGWAAFGFLEATQEMTSVQGRTHYGLPTVGFRATRLMNANVGVGAAYAAGDGHRYEHIVAGGSAPDWSQGISSM